MCHILNEEKQFKTKAYFRNANLPEGTGYEFEGIAIPCQCGDKTWFRPTKHPEKLIEVTKVSKL